MLFYTSTKSINIETHKATIMKNFIYIAITVFAGMFLLASFEELGHGKKDGTEPGHTGSPGDSLKNCTVCHGGTALPVDGWVRSNIPDEGYTPGATYTITAINSEHGATRFGFQVSPQAIDGTLLGTLVITDTARTKLVGNDKYVTYREAGVDGVDSLKWEFNWIAPAEGTGDVTFYAAFNSNAGHKDGDNTYLNKLIVREKWKTGLAKNTLMQFAAYPNPANNIVYVDVDNASPNLLIDVINLQGKQIEVTLTQQTNGLFGINTATLSNGTYIIRIHNNGKTATRKISVQH